MPSDAQENTDHGDGVRPLISKLLSIKGGRREKRRGVRYEYMLRIATLGGASG